MHDEEKFLAALLADRTDLATRLVYADWLEEQSDPRASYMRLLCVLDTSGTACPTGEQLRLAQRNLDPEWVNLVNRSRVPTDGVYQSPYHGSYWSYLRFYQDGTVLSVSSTGKPKQVWRWFNKQHGDLPKGTYTLFGADLSFSSTSSHGTVDYKGTFAGITITLDSHSHINGHRSTTTYQFVALPPEEDEKKSGKEG